MHKGWKRVALGFPQATWDFYKGVSVCGFTGEKKKKNIFCLVFGILRKLHWMRPSAVQTVKCSVNVKKTKKNKKNVKNEKKKKKQYT